MGIKKRNFCLFRINRKSKMKIPNNKFDPGNKRVDFDLSILLPVYIFVLPSK